jgi:hypothetical protein
MVGKSVGNSTYPCVLHLACNLVRLQMHFVLLAGLTLPQMLIWYSLVAASAAGGVPLCD